MKKTLFLMLAAVCCSFAAAQKIVTVSGEYTWYAPSTMTLDAAKQEAVLQTRLHVLADKFGTVVHSATTIVMENTDGGDSSSRTDVNTLATNEVKGEWLEDTREPEQTVSYDKSLPNTTIIHTRVWGKAREITGAKADIKAHLLKAPYQDAVADVFKNEQQFWLWFKSPVAGYLSVYLLDTEDDKAYCLLPAANDSRGAFPVESNKDYVLFDDTPYMFTAGHTLYNHISVIFSPNEFFKASDVQGQDDTYVLPRELPLKQFHQWLFRCKSHDTQLVETPLLVQIVKE